MPPIARLLAALCCLVTPALGQEKYPSRQISLIIGYPPGGSIDLAARALAPALQKATGQPVVIVTKVGAAGGIGAQAVAVAAPDGYSAGVATSQTSLLPAVDRVFNRKPAFQRSDFLPLARLTLEPMILTASTTQPWRTFKELIDEAKLRPGEIVYSSGGLYGISHLPVELIQKKAGIKFGHLPTAGGGPALTAVLGGSAAFVLQGPAAALPHVKAGKLRALAVLGSERHPGFPEAPTLKELGTDVEYYNWTGVFLPARTPEPIAKALGDAIAAAVKLPEFTEPLLKAGSAAAHLDRQAFAGWYQKNSEDSEAMVLSVGKIQ